MGMIHVAQDESTIAMDHNDSHSGYLQSADVMSHEKMMQSDDHADSQGISCESLCAASISLLPHIDFVPEVPHSAQLWASPESLDYLPNLHTLLYKPPRI